MNQSVQNDRKLESLKTVIRVKDYTASYSFYKNLLRLDIQEEYDDGNGSKGCIFIVNDNALIEISEILPNHSYYETQFDSDFSGNKIGIQIRTNNIQFWAEHLKDQWEIRGPVRRPWGSFYLYLRDPDSIQIIIYQEK